ncbi:MAG: nicotinamide-nucleotide amidohydrolase family protein, partial [Thermoguttaceae bacterium]|nr:nicotinamide-nucleotide amidohydrolase family protein [Thermoguttaceae bacterium]
MNEDPIGHVLVVGAGTMGRQIALQCALFGRKVALYDIEAGRLDEAAQWQATTLDAFVAAGWLRREQADAVKRQVLGVREQTLIDHGAVSDPVAREMADGARRLFGVDVALSVTGIAGPTGATAAKPVGLTYVGLSAPDGVWVRRFVWQG